MQDNITHSVIKKSPELRPKSQYDHDLVANVILIAWWVDLFIIFYDQKVPGIRVGFFILTGEKKNINK